MDNQNGNEQFINDEGGSNEYRKEPGSSHDDNFAFVPAENIRAIEKVIKNWEAVKKQWMKTSSPLPQDEGLH